MAELLKCAGSRRSLLGAASIGILLGVACRESPPTSPPAQAEVASIAGPGALARFPELARDIPEYKLDEFDHPLDFADPLLEREVEKANWTVIIELKPAGAKRSRESRLVPAMTRSEVAAARNSLRAAGIELIATFRYSSAVVARITPEQLRLLNVLPVVDNVHPNYVGKVEGSVARLQQGAQDTTWGVWKVRAPQVWQGLFGPAAAGQWVRVTVMDTGVDAVHLINGDGPQPLDYCLTHPLAGTDCYAGDGFHGAHMGGTIAAADNQEGIIGVAPELQGFASIRVCASETNCSLAAIEAALAWAIELGHPRHVVNLSLGFCEPWPRSLRQTLQAATNSGILVVAAAGNGYNNLNECGAGSSLSTTGVKYPAKYPEVLAVSGVDQADQFVWPPDVGGPPPPPDPCGDPHNLDPECPPQPQTGCTKGSRYGPEVDISAPFYAMGLGDGGSYKYDCGTSVSAAFVSGVAALVWSRHSNASASELRQLLQAHAVVLGPALQYGAGRVDAVGSAYPPTTPPPPPPPPLTAQLVGPDTAYAPGFHQWIATVAGGTGTYGYEWSWAETQQGTFTVLASGSTVNVYVNDGFPSRFWLKLSVQSGSASQVVYREVVNLTNNPCAPLVC